MDHKHTTAMNEETLRFILHETPSLPSRDALFVRGGAAGARVFPLFFLFSRLHQLHAFDSKVSVSPFLKVDFSEAFSF